MRWLGGVVAAAIAIGLGGCAQVTSETPWFGPDDARGAPRLKPGLWVLRVDECRPRADRSVRRWSDCGIVLIRDGEFLELGKDEKGRWVWNASPSLVAARDPLIMQLRRPPDGGYFYEYYGLLPQALDDQRQVVAARIWVALCETSGGEADGEGRRPLWPGLRWSPDGSGCLAESAEAVVAAAALTRSTGGETFRELYWVREPRPDDFAPDDFAKVRR